MAAPTSKFDHCKLETEFRKGSVVHTTYEWVLSARQRKVSTWKQEKQIGVGAFGSVWLERKEEGGQLRAVKRLSQDSLPKMDFSQELLALVKLREHAHLFVEFFGWYENRKKIFLAMEYIEHGDLSKYIRDQERKARMEAKAITRQILEGLEVLHEKGICHRDLKPQNVLVASLEPIWVKIADFGTSKWVKNTALRTRCGTEGYLAPELLGILPQTPQTKEDTEFTHALDMWSLGCLVHEILTSQTPFLELGNELDGFSESPESSFTEFEPEMDMDSFYEYCQGSKVFPTEILQGSRAGEEEITFVKSLLIPNPKDRPTAAQALHDPWLKDGHANYWYKNLETEFSSLGVSLDLGVEKGRLIKQIRKIDIMRFLPGSAKEEFPVLLQQAIQKGYDSAVEVLFNSPSSESVGRLTWGKMFRQAVKARQPNTITLLSTKINSKTLVDDQTILQWAVKERYYDSVKLLLNKFSDASIDTQGLLQRAITAGDIEMVKLLLGHWIGVNAEADDELGRTPLQIAAELGDIDIARLLLSNGADVNVKAGPYQGRTALQAAAEQGNLDVVELLLAKGADVNAKPSLSSGRTALEAAVGSGDIDVVKLLLDNKADVNVKPFQHSGSTALEAAAGCGDIDMVKLLLDHNADVNAFPDSLDNPTALQAAVQGGHFGVVELLLENGANANLESCYSGGRTALEVAIRAENIEIQDLLIDAMEKVPPVLHNKLRRSQELG